MKGPLVVIGDALLDVDLVGKVDRVAPDAPALVVDGVDKQSRPGGAALAASIAAEAGHEVVLIAPSADDEAGDELRSLVTGFRFVPLPWDGETAVKQRVRAGGQTLMRLDYGRAGGALGRLPEAALEVLGHAGAVLASDYGRGTLVDPGVRAALADVARPASGRGTPLVWDPHPRGMSPVEGTWLATPSQAEAELMAARPAGRRSSATGLARVQDDAERLAQDWSCAVAVTIGERGALLSRGDHAPEVVPTTPAFGTDVCGAGDCFAASAAAALGDGALMPDAVSAAVEAASAFVRDGGAAAFRRGEESAKPVVVATSGCFDVLHAGHVSMLSAARRLGDKLVVLLNSDASIRRLKGPSRPLVPAHDRARVLSALSCVDEVIVFDDDTPTEAIRQLKPNLWVKGGDYAGARLPEEEALKECGARAVTVPYLDGRSTTHIVEKARRQSAQRNREGAPA